MAANHPQLSSALSNVKALNEAYAQHRRDAAAGTTSRRHGADANADDAAGHRSRKKHKRREKSHKRSSKRSSGSSDDRKRRKKDGKSGKRSKRRGVSSSSSSSSSESESSSDDTNSLTIRQQVEMAQLAAEALRHMLAKFASERENFKKLLRAVDDGRGVSTSGVADERVRRYLEYFFEHACMRKSRATGSWTLPRSKDLGLWSRFNFVFDESVADRYSDAREPWLGPDPDVVAAEKSKKDEARAAKAAKSRPLGPGRVLTGDEAVAFMAEHNGSESDVDDVAPMANIGPAIGPSMGPSGAVEDEPVKRVLGPMVPPKSMLEAAAAALAMSDGVGPPPPEIVAEMEDTSNESREACAMRIARIISRGGDAYDILSVSPEDTAAVIKKKYWKLSLMVHPDKCSHVDARDAFDAIKKAHTALADETQRKAIDAKRNEANEREEFEAWLASEREAAAWRRLKGNPLPGDDELLDGPGTVDVDKREEWMTHLPPEKRPNQGPPTASVTAFSKTEKVARTAEMEAAWTDTPQQAAAREQQLFLAAQAQQYALPSAGVAKADETSRLVDEFNSTRRAKSLMEIHAERQQSNTKKEKKEKKDKKEKKSDTAQGKSSTWEYRPFNRDTDLKLAKEGAMKPDEALKRAGGGLGERFGGGKSTGGGARRSFL